MNTARYPLGVRMSQYRDSMKSPAKEDGSQIQLQRWANMKKFVERKARLVCHDALKTTRSFCP